MIRPSSQPPEDGLYDPLISSSLSSGLERAPLLQPSSQNESASSVRSEIEDENGIATTSDSPAIARQIFSTKLVAVMIGFFLAGVCTSSIGALISGIETFYKLTDGPTSFIFPTVAAGYLFGAWLLQRTLNIYGWRGVALLPPLFRLLSSILLSAGLPFPFIILSYFVQGLGLGLSDSGFCAWASKVPRANVVQGMIHGSFSLGAVLGPVLVISVSRNGFEWYNFYRLVAVLSCFEIAVFGTAFCRDNASRYHDSMTYDPVVNTKRAKLPFRLVAVWACGAFYFLYVGIEGSFSGWTIEYMKRIKHLDPTTASLSSSIFWIGMAIGRLSLGPITERFGLGKSVSTYITLATVSQILFKLTPDAILSLGFIGTNGFFLGPMYPSGIILLARKVSSQNKIGAVAAAAAMGQVGGALAPLAIGFLADSFGIGRMLDVVLVLSFVLLTMWLAFCRLPYCDEAHLGIRP